MDILLNSFGDLDISSDDFSITNSLAQKIAIHLRWFLGEWKFNKKVGVDYFGQILGSKNQNTDYFATLLTAEILKVNGVLEVSSINVTKNKNTLNVSFNVTSNEGYSGGSVAVEV